MEVITDEKQCQYLVRMDREPYALFSTERDAISAVDSIAAAEEKRLERPSTEVFRRKTKDGKEVYVSTRTSNFFREGPMVTQVVVDEIAVPRMTISYATKIAKFKEEKERDTKK